LFLTIYRKGLKYISEDVKTGIWKSKESDELIERMMDRGLMVASSDLNLEAKSELTICYTAKVAF